MPKQTIIDRWSKRNYTFLYTIPLTTDLAFAPAAKARNKKLLIERENIKLTANMPVAKAMPFQV